MYKYSNRATDHKMQLNTIDYINNTGSVKVIEVCRTIDNNKYLGNSSKINKMLGLERPKLQQCRHKKNKMMESLRIFNF